MKTRLFSALAFLASIALLALLVPAWALPMAAQSPPPLRLHWDLTPTAAPAIGESLESMTDSASSDYQARAVPAPDAEWVIETVDSAGNVGGCPSLALDVLDRPHISYDDDTNWALKYARWTGSAWAIETVDSAGRLALWASLALDASGHPHISYYDSTNRALKYARWTGSVWAIETVDTDVWDTSLAVDASGSPHISYYDPTNRALKYARWTGSSWATETVDGTDSEDLGVRSSLALDASGHPHISYYDLTNRALKYARWTGSVWAIETVDWGNAGWNNSLALDASGRPHISYDQGYGYRDQDLLYASWTGDAWAIETVDSAGEVGLANSLALDASGRPHISYRDYTNEYLKYARWTGSSWVIERVPTWDVAIATSLALDSEGKPHISYHSGSGCDLKYAYKLHAPPDTAPNGLDVSQLERGDVLLVNAGAPLLYLVGTFGGYWGHTAMYAGDGQIVESILEGVTERPIDETTFWTSRDWVVKRVNTTAHWKDYATSFAEDQAAADKPYNWNFWDKWRTDKYYCSQLVWRGYWEAGTDIDSDWSIESCLKTHNTVICDLLNASVPPDDIYYDNDVTEVQAKIWDAKRAVLYLGSPADLYITDPYGRHVGVDPITGSVVEEIPEVLYYSGPDAEPEHVVIMDMEGSWDVKVIGRESGSYTLVTEVVGLGEKHQVDYVTETTSPWQIDDYTLVYPTTPGDPIRVSEHPVYIPLIVR